MFDLTSSKLLILAIVALIVVGPKDLPLLLRTVGKYLGVIRRHAAEFRAQLDEAMREAELEELKKEFEGVGREVRSTLEEGKAAVDAEIETARIDVDEALKGRTGDGDPESGKAAEKAAGEKPAPQKTGTDAL